jgi:putative ABC transport system permease protein
MFVVALLGTAIAAFGPVYLAGENQTTLTEALRATVPANVGLTLQPTTPTNGKGLASANKALQRSDVATYFAAPIRTQLTSLSTSAHGQGYSSSIASRTGVCARLHFVSGSCPAKPGTMAVSDRSARLLGWKVGTHAVVTLGGSASVDLVVAGLYASGNSATPYWWGQNYFGYGTGTPARPRLDDIFASGRTIASAQGAARTGATSSRGKFPVSVFEQVPLRAGALTTGSVNGIEATLAVLAAADLHHGVRLSSGLSHVLAGAASTEHTAGTIVAVVDLELALFAVFVLYFVASRTAADREPDVRLAALRGYRPLSALAVAMSEPVAIVLAAVPVGVFCAWVGASAMTPAVFGAHVGVSVPVAAVIAAVGAGVAGLAATAVGTRHVLTSSADAPIGATSTLARHSVARIVAEVLAIGLAGAAFFELSVAGVATRHGSSTDALAALAPGLLALGVGVLGARLLPIALRPSQRRTEYSSRLAASYASRRVARRTEFTAVVLLGALAVGLTAFAISGWAIASRNRNARSAFDVGAPTVLTVSVPPGLTFLRTVRAAEHGRPDAMAAVVVRSSSGTTLAVDTKSLPSVVSWPPTMGIAASTMARRLVPAGLTHPVAVAGSSLSIRARAVESFSGQAPTLAVDLYDPDYQDSTRLTLGSLIPGTHTYTAPLAGGCPGGCRLTDLALSWTAPHPSSSARAAVTIDEMSEIRHGQSVAIDAGLSERGAWTATQGASAAPGAHGLAVEAHLTYLTATVSIAPNDAPAVLPTVVTPETASSASGHGGPLLVGLDGATVPGHTVAEVASLPSIGAGATLVDLQTAERLVATSFSTDTTEVWLSASAPPSVLASLRAHGLTVLARSTASARAEQLAKGGVGLAYFFFLLAAGAAGVLLLGAAAFAVVSGARRKQGELAVMRVMGLGRAALRRLFWTEQSLAVAAGAMLGAAAGILAAAVGMRSVPEFAQQGAGPPLDLALPGVLLAASLAGIAVALALATWLGASAMAQRATIEKLWESQG